MSRRPRGWRSLCEALRDPPRSDFAFVPHQYVHAPAELAEAALSPSESTPINAARKPRDAEAAAASQRNRCFARFLAAAGVAGVAGAWVALFPMAPTRLYNMQVDVFSTSHAHAVFFLRQCLYLGHVLGAALAGYLADKLGRLGTLELAIIPLLLGWVAIGVSYGEITVIIGRYLLGMSAGMMGVVVPVFLAEICAARIRGRVISLQAFFTGLGGLCYLGIGGLFIHFSRLYFGFNLSEWKVLAIVGLLPGIVLMMLTQKLPDTPTFLVAHHDDRSSALDIFLQLFSNDYKTAEYQTNAVIHARMLAIHDQTHHGAFYRPVLLCCSLAALRAVGLYLIKPAISSTPTNAFALTVLSVEVEGGDFQILYVLCFMWAAALVGTVACFFLIDTAGRQITLRAGCYVAAISSMFILAVTNDTKSLNMKLTDYSSAAILLLMVGQQLGLGIVPYVAASELFSVKQRLGAVSLVFICDGMVNLVLSHLAPLLRDTLSAADAFTASVAIVGACNIAGLLISWLYIPETSGRSLQEIEAILSGWQPATPQRSGSRVRLGYGSNGF